MNLVFKKNILFEVCWKLLFKC